MKEKCIVCGKNEMETIRGNHHFTESGLNNVTLCGIEIARCSNCGNEEPIIRGLDDVLRTIALALVSKPYRLAGDEVRYLRNYLEMAADKFARLLHVDRVTLSKWENGEDPVGAQSDLAIRMLVMSVDEGLKDKLPNVVREQFEKIQYKLKRRKGKFIPEKPMIQVGSAMDFFFA